MPGYQLKVVRDFLKKLFKSRMLKWNVTFPFFFLVWCFLLCTLGVLGLHSFVLYDEIDLSTKFLGDFWNQSPKWHLLWLTLILSQKFTVPILGFLLLQITYYLYMFRGKWMNDALSRPFFLVYTKFKVEAIRCYKWKHFLLYFIIFFLPSFRWACIALTTLLIRGATLPLLINQLKATAKLTVCGNLLVTAT